MRPASSLRFTILLVAIATASIASGRSPALSGTIAGVEQHVTLELRVAHAKGHRLVASGTTGPDGGFRFSTADLPLGFYQLSLNDTDRVEIILGPHERDVVLHFDGIPLRDHIRVERGTENIRLWQYKLVSKRALYMMRELQAHKEAFPNSNEPKLDSLVREAFAARVAYMAGLQEQWPDSYFARVVRTDKAIDAAAPDDPAAVLRAADLSDGSLLRSAVFSKAIMAYLQRIEAVDDHSYIPAVDTLLKHTSRDTACWNQVFSELVTAFGSYQMDAPLRHLADVHAAKATGLPVSVVNALNDLVRVAVGTIGPDVLLPGLNGDTVWLSRLAAAKDHTLLFFYSSNCGHCHEQMPWLKRLHATENSFQVVGIALDDDRDEFLATIQENDLPWPSFTELKAWGSPAAKAYGISATPSFILLHRDLRILAKPFDEEALMDVLRRLKP